MFWLFWQEYSILCPAETSKCLENAWYFFRIWKKIKVALYFQKWSINMLIYIFYIEQKIELRHMLVGSFNFLHLPIGGINLISNI